MKKTFLILTLAIVVLTTFSCASHNEQLMGAAGAAGGATYAVLSGLSPTATALYTIGGAVGGMYLGNAIDQKKQKNRDMDQYAAIEEARREARARYHSASGGSSGGGGYGVPQDNTSTNCEKTTTRKWSNGKLIVENTEEICRGNKSTNRY